RWAVRCDRRRHPRRAADLAPVAPHHPARVRLEVDPMSRAARILEVLVAADERDVTTAEVLAGLMPLGVDSAGTVVIPPARASVPVPVVIDAAPEAAT